MQPEQETERSSRFHRNSVPQAIVGQTSPEAYHTNWGEMSNSKVLVHH